MLCAEKKGGDLSVAGGKGKCAKRERKLTVAKEGPVGAVGPQGAPGAASSATLEPVDAELGCAVLDGISFHP